MADYGPIFPDADGIAISMGTSGTLYYDQINTDPDTNPTTGSYVYGLYNTADAELWMSLQALPADFDTMTSVEVRIYVQTTGTYANDILVLGTAWADGDNSNTYLAGASSTTTQTVTTWDDANNPPATQVYAVNYAYVNTSATKAQWEAGYLHFHWVKTKSGGWDSNVLQVAAVEVNGVYVTTVTYPYRKISVPVLERSQLLVARESGRLN